MLIRKTFFSRYIFFIFSQSLFACPLDCDENFLPVFVAWEEKVWGEGAKISSPLDHVVIDKQRQEKLTNQDDKWNSFLQKLKPTDTLHFFVTDEKSRGMLLGLEGYAIVRKGKVIETYITMFY
ncbi:MAG: hypothetical protein LBU43_02850 [Candidatus Accumulibacter sp.]|jgi:hypothetical protein|nr:hypothetical protein [Accumulibacter sp.]